MSTKCSRFYVKANQRDKTKEEKGEKMREVRSSSTGEQQHGGAAAFTRSSSKGEQEHGGAAGEGAAILQQRIRESAHRGVDENRAEADLAEVGAKSLTSVHLDNLQR